MFRDSFARPCMPFLGHSFRRITCIWEQNWDKRIIGIEKPDIGIDEMVERFVISRDAGEIRRKDDQPEVQMFADW